MKILLVNVDSRFNLAIRRMYNYFKNEHEVIMKDLGLDGYPNRKKINHIYTQNGHKMGV